MPVQEQDCGGLLEQVLCGPAGAEPVQKKPVCALCLSVTELLGRYCTDKSLWQSVVTGVLPTVLVTIWQTCVLPYAFYWCGHGQRQT